MRKLHLLFALLLLNTFSPATTTDTWVAEIRIEKSTIYGPFAEVVFGRQLNIFELRDKSKSLIHREVENGPVSWKRSVKKISLAFPEKPDVKKCLDFLNENFEDLRPDLPLLICNNVNFHKISAEPIVIEFSLRKPPKPSEQGARLYTKLNWERSVHIGNFPLKKDYKGEFPEFSLALALQKDDDLRIFIVFCTRKLNSNSPFFFGTDGFYNPEDICLAVGSYYLR